MCIRDRYNANERYPEVGAVTYTPGVYKIYMVRMVETPDAVSYTHLDVSKRQPPGCGR